MPVTLGVDLATEPDKTGWCAIDWRDDEPRSLRADSGGDIDELVRVADDVGADWVAVDAPFGWPRPWARAISRHHPGEEFEAASSSTSEITLRTTDAFVHRQTGIPPLRVAADRIGATAITCSWLLAKLKDADFVIDVGQPITTLNAPAVSEVYPKTLLAKWGPRRDGYKESSDEHRARREAILDQLQEQRLVPSDPSLRSSAVGNADVLDAVVCAVLARATQVGLTYDAAASDQDEETIHREGWIRFLRDDAEPSALWAS